MVRIALLTTPGTAGSPTSPVERCVHDLLPHLAERVEVSLFVDREAAELAVPESAAFPLHDATQLDPKAFEQVVYAIGNDPAHGYMFSLVRRIGGVAALFDWCLARAARAAYPGLEAGGALGGWLGMREGGRAGLRSKDGATVEPALNRSVVRCADSFLLPTEELRERVLADRNEPTPIAVIDHTTDPAEVARLWAEALAAFPPHRAARKSIFRSILEAVRGG